MIEQNTVPSQEIKSTFSNRLGVFSFKIVEKIISATPLIFICHIGKLAGWLAYYMLPSRKQIVARNLRIVLNPSLKGKELNKLVKENFCRSVMNMVAASKTATMSDKALLKHTKLDGIEIFDDPDTEKHGLLCAVAHSGNWELLSRTYTFFPSAKLYGSMYRRMENPLLEKYLYSKRTSNGSHMFSKEDGIPAPLSFVKKGAGLGILCDQFVQEGVFVPYFGKVTGTTYLPALMQRRTKAKIKPCVVATEKTGFWVCHTSHGLAPDDSSGNFAADTIAVNKLLEEQISKSPLDGFWMHNRWKVFSIFAPHDPKTEIILKTLDLKPFRILFFTPDSFENAILCVPVVKAVKACRCDMQINIVCPPEQAGFWQTVAEVASVTKKSTVSRLREDLSDPAMYDQGPYDMAFLLDNSKLSVKALKKFQPLAFSGLSSHPYAKKRRVFRTISSDLPLGKARHKIEDYLNLLKEHKIHFENGSFFPQKNQLCSQSNEIGLAPFSTLGKANEWPLAHWKNLLEKLKPLKKVTLFALPENKKEANEWANDLKIPCQIGTAEDLLQAMPKINSLICVDGLIPSIAAHAGIPVLALFSTRTPERYRPLGTFHECIHHHKACSPCFLGQCDQAEKCIETITPEEVFSKYQTFFETNG